MNLLILGGTQFLGRHIVEAAIQKSHNITLLNRGKSNPDLFTDLNCIRGDRNDEKVLKELQSQKWDCVIDCCGYQPDSVSKSLHALRESADHYIFISSVSVYSDFSERIIKEDSKKQTPTNSTNLNSDDPATYGLRKYACEERVRTIFPTASTILRPGLIVGPWDTTWRFPYWIDRVNFGGEILSPGSPNDPVQFIDARDLANFILRTAESNHYGTFNTVGPGFSLPLGELLNSIKSTLNSDCSFRWVGEDFLLNLEVQPWTHLPLWLPIKSQGVFRVEDRKARLKGLQSRPIEETIRDTSDWMIDAPKRIKLEYGLSQSRERELLDMWPT